MKKVFSGIIFVLGFKAFLFCQTVFSFSAASFLTPTQNATNTTSSDISLAPSGTIETNITTGTLFMNEPYIQESSWTSTSQSGAKAFCFTITPSANFKINITNFSYQALATGAGPTATGFSIGGTFYSGSLLGDGTLSSINSAINDKNNITSPTNVCIQGWLDGSRTSTGGGDFRIDEVTLTISSMSTLPVKLKAPMTVIQKGRDVESSWTTASEINNSHFEVEHSLDGINYDVIGRVQGSNETDFDKAYKFTHKNAPESVNFYRLTQHDFDGKSETFDATSIDVVAEGGFLIYPTHTHDFINVRGGIDGFSIYDATGKFILFTKGDKQIDVSNFNKGMYLLKSGTKVAKFVKL
jgi:hypothetical protein